MVLFRVLYSSLFSCYSTYVHGDTRVVCSTLVIVVVHCSCLLDNWGVVNGCV